MDKSLVLLCLVGVSLMCFVEIHESAKIPSKFEMLKSRVKNPDLKCYVCLDDDCKNSTVTTKKCSDLSEDDQVFDLFDVNDLYDQFDLNNMEYRCLFTSNKDDSASGIHIFQGCTFNKIDDEDFCAWAGKVFKFMLQLDPATTKCSLCSTDLCNKRDVK